MLWRLPGFVVRYFLFQSQLSFLRSDTPYPFCFIPFFFRYLFLSLSILWFLILFIFFTTLLRSVSRLDTLYLFICHGRSVLPGDVLCSCREIFELPWLQSKWVLYGAWNYNSALDWNKKRDTKDRCVPFFICMLSRGRVSMGNQIAQAKDTVPGTVRINWWISEKSKLAHALKLVWVTLEKSQFLLLILYCPLVQTTIL